MTAKVDLASAQIVPSMPTSATVRSALPLSVIGAATLSVGRADSGTAHEPGATT